MSRHRRCQINTLQHRLAGLRATLSTHCSIKPPAMAVAPPLRAVDRRSAARPALRRGLPQGQKFEYLLNTGNLVSRSGLDLSQSTGFTVVAEKLNYFRWGPRPAARVRCAPSTAALFAYCRLVAAWLSPVTGVVWAGPAGARN